MTTRLDEQLLLDTSALVDLVRKNRTGKFLEHQYRLSTRPARPFVSTIPIGELLGLAKLLSWGPRKQSALERLLGNCVHWEAGDELVIEAYAELFFEMRRHKQTTGQNDLWIAATAKVAGAVLLTCDADFSWMNPDLIRVEFVARNQ